MAIVLILAIVASGVGAFLYHRANSRQKSSIDVSGFNLSIDTAAPAKKN